MTSRSPTKRGRAGPEHSEGRTATRGALPTLEWTEQERTNVDAPVFKAHSTHGRVTQGKCATLARAGAVLRKRLLLLLVVRDRRPSSAAPTPRTQPLSCLPSTVYQTQDSLGFGTGSDAESSSSWTVQGALRMLSVRRRGRDREVKRHSNRVPPVGTEGRCRR